MASTASATIPAPPGGPILVVTPAARSSRNYLPEILRSEGLNDFDVADIGSVSPATLATTTSWSSRTCRSPTRPGWRCSPTGSSRGGNLIAMRPRANLAAAPRPQPGRRATPAAGGYLRVNTSTAPGAGITNGDPVPRQRRPLRAQRRRRVANLWSSASSPTGNPAVSLRSVGASGGQAAAFTFDLAQSVIQTRQGNPAWAGKERDGSAPIRSDDLFFGGADCSPTGSTSTRPPSLRPTSSSGCWPTSSPTWRAHQCRASGTCPTGSRRPSCSPATITAATAAAARRPALPHDVAAKPSCSAAELANWDCVRSTCYVVPGLRADGGRRGALSGARASRSRCTCT